MFNKKRFAGITLAGMIAFTGAVTTFAASQTSSSQQYANQRQLVRIDASQMSDLVKSTLDSFVTAGTITEVQEDAIINTLPSRGGKDGPKGERKNPMDSLVTAGTITQEQADAIQDALISPDGSFEEIEEADISSMTESDMRGMLEKIQERTKNAPEMGEGMPPPPPPMMGGFDPSQMLSGMFGSQNDTGSVSSSNDNESILQQIIDNLTESYDSSTESSDDYVEKLKDSLNSMFSQQKSEIDNFYSMIFNKLDAWNSEEKTKTQET